MSEDVNKEAYKQALEELKKKKVEEVKGFILETLEKIEKKKADKEKIEEELRVLKLDLEDLQKGNFSKIEERLEKSKLARSVSVFPSKGMNSIEYYTSDTSIGTDWTTLTTGTYPLRTSNKIFYLG